MRRRHLIVAVPAALLAACATGEAHQTFTVFFTEDSAALEDHAQALLRQVAATAKSGSQPVIVRGFAGPAGGAAYNRALSEARARHVADMLIREGVPQSRIHIIPRGPVPFEAMPTEARRVEIRLGL